MLFRREPGLIRARTGSRQNGTQIRLDAARHNCAGRGAVAACTKAPEAPPFGGRVGFAHGVASGDPTQDSIVLWTRVSPDQAGPAPVRWVLARNQELTQVVKTGVIETDAARDYTVKVDVTGLRSGAPYFYGFLCGDQVSPVGKTQTLSQARLAKLTLAVASCASFPHGFFNAYEAIARDDAVDVVVHLGDYIYEYGVSGYGGESAIRLGRIPNPQIECVALADYRLRHAQAKAEPELQAAHARCPWIVAWDDHEIANHDWSGGAERSTGDWAARKQAALQAYYEWMPIRDPAPGYAFEAINRSFQFGDLASLIMLETRLLQRTQPFDLARETPLRMRAWNFANPNAPLPLAAPLPGANVRMLPAPYEEIDGEAREVSDWGRVKNLIADPLHPPPGFFFLPDSVRLAEMLNAPERTLLGAAQERWFERQLKDSVAAAKPWQIIGNQVLMAHVDAPDLSSLSDNAIAQIERKQPGARRKINFTRSALPLNTDAWDGYPASRARVLGAMRRANAHAIVLSGDSHAAWANEISDANGRVAVELGTTSITSPNEADVFLAHGFNFASGLKARNPHIKWTDQIRRGFLKLTLTKVAAKAEFVTVSTVASKEYQVARAAAFTIAPDEGGVVGALQVYNGE